MLAVGILGAFPVALSTAGTAAAQTPVGVVSLINPAATLDRADDVREPAVGEDILLADRLSTDDDGQMHLMMLDKSSFTIGPNSDITIDRFVYDPETRSGEMAMSAVRGVMRFVGGDLSKDQPVEIRTSIGTLGIRGGILLLNISADGGMTAVFGYGVSLTVATAAGEQAFESINRAGFMVQVSPSGEISDPVPATPEIIDGILNDLEGPSRPPEQQGNGGGVTIDEFTLDGQSVTIDRIIDSDDGPLAEIGGQLVSLERVIEDTIETAGLREDLADLLDDMDELTEDLTEDLDDALTESLSNDIVADVTAELIALFKVRVFDHSSLDGDIVRITISDGITEIIEDGPSDTGWNLGTGSTPNDYEGSFADTFRVGQVQVTIESLDEGAQPNTVGLEIQSDFTDANATFSPTTSGSPPANPTEPTGDTFEFNLRDDAADGPTSVTVDIEATNGAGS